MTIAFNQFQAVAAHHHDRGDERGLAFHGRFQDSEGWVLELRKVRKVPSERVVAGS
jgi:hypothetical protein